MTATSAAVPQKQVNLLFSKYASLFLMSSLGLFLELAVIRWLSGEVRLLAYFKNIPLLAAFLGFAIGFALVKKGRDYRFDFPVLWLLFVIVVIAVGWQTRGRTLVYPGFDDLLFFHSMKTQLWLELVLFLGQIGLFFLVTLLLFIPVGQATGEEMSHLPPVKAYIVNIAASIFGTWLFALVSFLQTPPVIWFGLSLLMMAFFFGFKQKMRWQTALIFIVTLLGVSFAGKGAIWSPYNRLNITKVSLPGTNNQAVPIGYSLDVQFTTYMDAFNLSRVGINNLRQAGVNTGELESAAKYYEIPYLLVPMDSQVLIVGSGMGNDIAGALRVGMQDIVAVEIDPAIVQLGKEYHPEHPYANSSVRTVIDDARSFLNKSPDQYDIVSFGLLDSHTLLSSMSSVRIDSYVYTIESFETVKAHLKPGGIFVVNFAANDWIRERMGRMLEQVFGADKVYVADTDYYKSSGKIFIIGSLTNEQIQTAGARFWSPDPAYDHIPLTTDDWPYLYNKLKTIPMSYWEAILVVGLIAFFVARRSFPQVLHPDWHFWFLGAAFLLIEFKNISELALLFGTTWFVNTLAISGVLFMALGANIFVLSVKKINLRIIYGLLFASLLIGFLFPLESLGGLGLMAKSITGTAILCLPLLFAGVIFSESLRRAGETSGPIASNFTGSAVGGLLEYSSLVWGLKSLHIISAILYLGSALVSLGKRRK
jgi:spermidine synthase